MKTALRLRPLLTATALGAASVLASGCVIGNPVVPCYLSPDAGACLNREPDAGVTCQLETADAGTNATGEAIPPTTSCSWK